jgi:hypothetical protein
MPDLSLNAAEILAKYEATIATYPESEVSVIPDDGDYDHRLVGQSLLNAQVCTRLGPQDAAAWLSTVRPPGTSHGLWEFDPDGGETICEQFPETHRHVLVNC